MTRDIRIMETEPISVIVPVYNTEGDLPRCLTSICSQTYKNIEVICVDDGSTDGSGEIIDRFARKDTRIIALHQDNHGESNARNAGLEMATGNWIAFCDCDDWIESDMYECLMAYSDEADLLASSWFKDTPNQTERIKNEYPVPDGIIENRALLHYTYKRDSYRGFAYMWNKLYRRSVLDDGTGHLIRFDESLRLGGDVLYLARAALNTKRTRYIDRAFYHYNQRPESGCHTRDVSKLSDWLRAYGMVIALFEEAGVDKEVVGYVKRFLAYHASNAAEIAAEDGNQKAKTEFQDVMRSYKTWYLELNRDQPERIARYERLLTE